MTTGRIRQQADDAGSKVQQSSAYRVLVSVGLVCFGLIHLVLGWISLQLAFGSGGEEASTSGALKDLVGKPFGAVLVTVLGIGMAALVVWQAIEAVKGYQWLEDRKKIIKRISSAGRAVVYAALAVTSLKLVMGSASDSNQSAKGATATLMSVPMGQFLVGIAGLVVAGVGVSQIVKGVRRKFVEEDLEGSVPEWGKKLGVVGWCAKGLSLVLVGAVIAWSAYSFDPQKAAGVDGALKTLVQQPFGWVLLAVMALGFLCFGAYCFVWSRNARHSR